MEADSRARFRAFTDVSNTLHQPLHATAPECLNNSSKPSTLQLRRRPVVTSSGFRGAAVKQQLQQLASQFGAAYSGELVQGHTTHLVSCSVCCLACPQARSHLYMHACMTTMVFLLQVCKRLIDCFATLK
jgi:hypothetical protein